MEVTAFINFSLSMTFALLSITGGAVACLSASVHVSWIQEIVVDKTTAGSCGIAACGTGLGDCSKGHLLVATCLK